MSEIDFMDVLNAMLETLGEMAERFDMDDEDIVRVLAELIATTMDASDISVVKTEKGHLRLGRQG